MTDLKARSKSFGSSDASTSRAISLKRAWRSAAVSLGLVAIRDAFVTSHFLAGKL